MSTKELITNAIDEGFKVFATYDPSRKNVSQSYQLFFEKLTILVQSADLFLSEPQLFANLQKEAFQVIYSKELNLSKSVQVYCEFMLGLSRFRLATIIANRFCEFLLKNNNSAKSSQAMNGDWDYGVPNRDFWQPFYKEAELLKNNLDVVIKATDNFTSCDYWKNAGEFFKQNHSLEALAKELVSMQFIPEDRSMLGIMQTLHWGGFGGSGEFLNKFEELKPLLAHRIGYHEKESGGFNSRLTTILGQQQKMRDFTLEIFKEHIIPKLGRSNSIRIFDVGSGPHYLGVVEIIKILAELGFNIALTASDVDDESVRQLSDKIGNDHHLKHVELLDLNLVSEMLAVKHDEYDLITASIVLHQLPKEQIIEVLKYFTKITRVGGFILNPDVGGDAHYQALLVPANEVDREGSVPACYLHDLEVTAIYLPSGDVKFLYPLVQCYRSFPSEQIALYQVNAYTVVQISLKEFMAVKNLWAEKDYLQANAIAMWT